jgi:N-acetylglucosaminyldiphosphoundecaprenol N-acetyl-beta-D-mannosaminyltransferase
MTTLSLDPGQRTILGVRFFLGTAAEAVECSAAGGLVLIPAAPALVGIATNRVYREALLAGDIVLTDSAFMVLLWNRFEQDRIRRVSGLTYLRELLQLGCFRVAGQTLWIMPSERSVLRTSRWLGRQGIEVPSTHLYVAPMYPSGESVLVADAALLERIEQLRPRHILLGIGGGTQEPLGAYLKKNLSYLPAIHCVGAAIGFLTGEQVAIPVWADRFYLGWLLRTLHQPRRFAPRYWEARKLYGLLKQWRDRLPELRS